ncbi:hypothetical protein RESH_04005 [Rhodopirellula europaea SH398]|uniref:Uncharacterized protein n=1 Tax=Rhodopirellula europaea SH398 TaxID=1263868 RepID=M5SCJ5_9BACT|nr:hypothetical protein RESH_04005 [Rhodopirellula europaea SH398]
MNPCGQIRPIFTSPASRPDARNRQSHSQSNRWMSGNLPHFGIVIGHYPTKTRTGAVLNLRNDFSVHG